MAVEFSIQNEISAANSTTALLGAGATFTGAWEDVTEYNTVSSAVLGSLATDGTLYFDLSTDAGSTFTSVPNAISDATFAVPRILNIVETHVRIRYVNGTTTQTGTFSLQTKYAVSQQMTLLGPLDGVINSENPASLVRIGNEFEIDVAREHLIGQKSCFFFGQNDTLVNGTWNDVSPMHNDFNWQTVAAKVKVASTNAADTSAGLGLRSVEIHGLSATGVEQSEVLALSGITAVESVLTYIRVNVIHNEEVGTYGGSHQGDIECRVTNAVFASGALLQKMIGHEGVVDSSVQYGFGESQYGGYTVPLGKVMYLTRLEVIPQTSKAFDIALYERDGSLTISAPFLPRRILWSADQVQDAPIEKEFKTHLKIKGLTDIWFRAKGDVNNAGCSVWMDFYLLDADSEGR